MNIKPLSDRVVVKLVEAEEKTKTGIFLTASAQEKPQVSVIEAVGPGGLVDGKYYQYANVSVGNGVVEREGVDWW